MKVCPKCGFVDRSMWRQNRWRTNVEFLKYLDYPEDIDLEILNRLKAGHEFAFDKLHAYQLSSQVIERVLLSDFEIAGKDAFHIPREKVDHRKDVAQTKLLMREGKS